MLPECPDCGEIACICPFETGELVVLKNDILDGVRTSKHTLSILAKQAMIKADPFEKVEIEKVRETVVMKDMQPDTIHLLRWVALAMESPKEKMM